MGFRPTVPATSGEIIVTSAPVLTSALKIGGCWTTGVYGPGVTFAAVPASMIPTSRKSCDLLWTPQTHGMGIKPQISSGIGHLLNAKDRVVEQPVTGFYGVRHRVVETFDLAVPEQGKLATVG